MKKSQPTTKRKLWVSIPPSITNIVISNTLNNVLYIIYDMKYTFHFHSISSNFHITYTLQGCLTNILPWFIHSLTFFLRKMVYKINKIFNTRIKGYRTNPHCTPWYYYVSLTKEQIRKRWQIIMTSTKMAMAKLTKYCRCVKT